VSINKRKGDAVEEETKKMREFENIYGTTNARARLPAHPTCSNCSPPSARLPPNP